MECCRGVMASLTEEIPRTANLQHQASSNVVSVLSGSCFPIRRNYQSFRAEFSFTGGGSVLLQCEESEDSRKLRRLVSRKMCSLECPARVLPRHAYCTRS